MDLLEKVEMAPDDPILQLFADYKSDPRTQKINLGIGAYQNEQGAPQLLSCVHEAESWLVAKQLDKEYPPILGHPNYIRHTLELLYGKKSEIIAEERLFGAQTLGATGALRIGAELLARNAISRQVYISNPSWPNHRKVFVAAGFTAESYPYYQQGVDRLMFEEMCSAISQIPTHSTLVIQPCCHNPTGMDLTQEQWQILSQICKAKQLIPFFDLAYQGFGCGIEEDAAMIRDFANDGHTILVASSYSKNLGLYGERVGLLSIVAKSSSDKCRVESAVKDLIRRSYSMPPIHGARIAEAVLSSEEWRRSWLEELHQMRNRMQTMRHELYVGLNEQVKDQRFEILRRQRGMFSYLPLTPEQVLQLREQHAIYMTSSGRINVAGLHQSNLKTVINAIAEVVGR